MNVAAPLRHRGLRVAYVYGGSTGAWMAHLIFASGYVRYSCNASGSGWWQHVATAVCAVVAAHAAWVAHGLYRDGRADSEDAGTPLGATHFIGLVGIIVALTNVLLILAEGSYVGLIHGPCRP